MDVHPLLILAVGVATVIGMILVLRINAFMALITAAILVSLLAPGELADKISRVAEAFGESAGKIGIVIALAAVIGECMMRSGAADRIVQAFLRLLGVKQASVALLGSGFVLAVPVFFDTVFYLLVPLARSLYRRTGQNYLLYLLAIAAGGAITHTLVPPTPGPLVMADQLGIDIGAMIIAGAAVALPAAIVGVLLAHVFDRLVPVPFREVRTGPEMRALDDHELPPLSLSVLPVVLPVLLISANTVVGTLMKQTTEPSSLARLEEISQWTAVIGNPNLALLISTAVAMWLLWRQQRPTLTKMSEMVETSLMSGGAIILITAGGGAFGAMLKVAQIGPAIEGYFSGSGGAASGLTFMLLGYLIAVLLKVAQGSSTVAMITASSMLAATIAGGVDLGYHPVYLATAIGAGSLMGSWMNDSGFWIFAKMGGLTEAEALKSWTPMLAAMSLVSLGTSIVLAITVPMV
ncbi:Gnt-II system L-idonate transporter [Maioricimonas rarisocia]|uniref:Gnt-II system L-idonate transporter n=1 Tax=Maioricimonas rarisocia TaxID=2528026 RepID=A0A517ZCK5_9PLAN|nr:Gnt-II system L-idonate transporter [Maioricimonas rarisocia]